MTARHVVPCSTAVSGLSHFTAHKTTISTPGLVRRPHTHHPHHPAIYPLCSLEPTRTVGFPRVVKKVPRTFAIRMMHHFEIALAPEAADDARAHRNHAAAHLGVDPSAIRAVVVRRRSIDARSSRVLIRLKVDVFVDEDPGDQEGPRPEYREVTGNRRMVVVGAGPAGLFAALRLIELGVRPIIVERGKDVRARRRDLVQVQRYGNVNPDSNYCFGEGGAGTYSDGKLYTRATKRGDVNAILRTLVAHGADPSILVDAHPHIGSNRLPQVVAAIRNSIVTAGGEIHFEKRVIALSRDTSGRVVGVRTLDGSEFIGEGVILATGHSARDIFQLLIDSGIIIEAKSFSMGVRIEHPQPLIDRIQYHTRRRNEHLPAASYRLATTVRDRGVYSFCMCPGGFIVPTATESDEVVVNGMSLSRRDSPFANSGMVVSIEQEDLAPFQMHGALAGVRFQKELETMAAREGMGMQRAPAQRLLDFLDGKTSSTLPDSSYRPGLTSAPLHELLPASIAARLADGLRLFGKGMKGYLSTDAVLVGVETRTSSPVRVPRDPTTMQHPTTPGLFPCGEGAGYAGGIVSAVLDGVACVEGC